MADSMIRPTLKTVAKALCWIGLHNRRGWYTDRSIAFAPALGAFFPSGPVARIRKYRQFNKCERCGDVLCRFTDA